MEITTLGREPVSIIYYTRTCKLGCCLPESFYIFVDDHHNDTWNLKVVRFYGEFRVFGGWRQFSIEKGLFLTNGSKRWRFFVLIDARANANIFRVKKSLKILKKLFLKHPVSSEDQNSAAPFLFMLVSARLSLTHWYYCKL